VVGATSLAWGRPTLKELRDRADEDVIATVQAAAPQLVEVTRQANLAKREERWGDAARLYQQVHESAPAITQITRRLCGAELEVGHRERALSLCREAAKDGSADNLQALASTLTGDGKGTPEEVAEAKTLADKAANLAPEDVWSQYIQCHVTLRQPALDSEPSCVSWLRDNAPLEMATPIMALYGIRLVEGPQGAVRAGEARRVLDDAKALAPNEPVVWIGQADVALATNDEPLLIAAVERLGVLAPDNPQTEIYRTLQQARAGDFDDARESLLRAQSLGADPAVTADLMSKLDDAMPWYQRWGKQALAVVGVWLAGMVALLGVGLLLSGVALRAAHRPPADQSGRAQGMGAALRRAYAVVLGLCCVYYYVSIPLVLILAVGVPAGIIYGIWSIGYIAPKLFIVMGLIAVVTVIAMLKALFVRPVHSEPGMPLPLAEHPEFAEVLQRVAAKVGTRPVDKVYLTPHVEAAVFEQGGMAAQLRGKTQRCLILGLALLDGMKLDQLEAILAHEYGHLSNRDTAGGGFALAVRRSLIMTARGLAEAGAATKLNPAWLFVTGFYKLFLRISHGASRLQEVLADRWAAYSYGAEAFVGGLTHVVRRSVEFDHFANRTLEELSRSGAGLANLYTYEPSAPADAKAVEEAIASALRRTPSVYDSHPAPETRFQLVRNLPGIASVKGELAAEAWSVFPKRRELEEAVTRLFCSEVHAATGLFIPGVATQTPATPGA